MENRSSFFSSWHTNRCSFFFFFAKVWNMGDLGLQALQSVAAADSPVLRLEELSQNFPSHASALSALKVQPGTREEAQVHMCVGGGF